MRVYAYSDSSFVYNIDCKLDTWFVGGGEVLLQGHYLPDEDCIYHFDNALLTGVAYMSFYLMEDYFIFPLNPEYDYYFIGSMIAPCRNSELDNSTFKPSVIKLQYSDVDQGGASVQYASSDLNVYDIDGEYYKGFGFYEKVDFLSAGNIGISSISFERDAQSRGNKPANLELKLGVMAIPKSSDSLEVSRQILNKLSEMESSITGSIDAAGDKVADAIENQYAVSESEDFGVGQIADQVEEKLGVLSFGADTLNNFLGLFQASNAGSTVLTFPGFTINVQGESYRVWNDIQFDLSFLEENFGFLIDTVRTVTVLCVWLAVLGYLVKAYEHLVNNKG